MTHRRAGTCLSGALLLALGGAGCDEGSSPDGGETTLAATASPANRGASGLPDGPLHGVPRPHGPARNLRVLDWAGFAGAVTYTFDDSQPSHIQHYAELQATGVRMTFYINRETAIGSLATWQQALADGHEIANHTVHHCHAPSPDNPVLNGCSFGPLPADATPDSEIDENSDFIRDEVGQDGVWTMATPFGDAGWDRFAATRFLANRDVFQGMVAPGSSADPFHLPCYMAGAPQDGGIGGTEAEFDGLIDTARADGMWMTFLFHTILPTADNWFGPVDIGEITGSVDHARQLGDVWVDSMVNVASYWRGQALFDSLVPTTHRHVTTWTWQLPASFPPGVHLRVTVDGGTLRQGGAALHWNQHGYYEVSLDAGSLTLSR
ncbi:MAG TPA: polysaccharide deacetylase family protein [Kofleriaceae bacterium]|nr:polysaccharide deacetylase family protein [Kofleriaceae bacterium]